MNEQDLPALPSYIYGREAGANERVWTESAVRELRLVCMAAGMTKAAVICDKRAKGWEEDTPDGLEGINDHRRDEATYCASDIRAAMFSNYA